jgi:hypothetical protein
MVSRAVSAKSGIPRYVLTAYGCTIISTTLWSEKIIFASDFIIFVQQKWQTINQSNLTPVLAELMQAATVAHEIVASKIQIHFELLASVIQQMTGHVSTPFIKHMKSRHLQTKIQYTPDRIHHTCAYYLFYNLYVVNRSLERNCIPRYVGRYPPMSTYLGMRNLPQRRKNSGFLAEPACMHTIPETRWDAITLYTRFPSPPDILIIAICLFPVSCHYLLITNVIFDLSYYTVVSSVHPFFTTKTLSSDRNIKHELTAQAKAA